MKILELFSGTESFSKVARARGHEVFTIDNNPQFKPDLCIDILEFTPAHLPREFACPDIIWASPPCTTFSVASIRHYWDNGFPKNHKTFIGLAIVSKTLEIIREINPKFWFMENPRGMLRKQKIVENLKRDTVTYCQYGHKTQKPTDIFNNCLNWKARPMCKPGADCHERAGRGAKTGVRGIYNLAWENARGNSATARGVIPADLCLEIIKACEEDV